ncbi:AraC-type DNA-binding protein [Paenibacillus algorifonticola]|uniref:AraC-type DNA-binding protein n=1 Tax=Paenibacillus algorifonticola TaxID=684063 RepID=A0A1I2E7J6_9BACL|nr:helix-turn-helix transcriptional regulator [Paenibacillus algorifonticola]SFE88677.1 AraC-type DNA-binding protein [Paenibacillus algorifonticola]
MEIPYAEGINVESVSLYVGVNRTHFTKQFSKAYGITPVQYIQQLKMGEAKRLLAQTGYTLSEIASSIGFPDLFSFSKAFKKNMGVAPKQYRSQLISGQRESND